MGYMEMSFVLVMLLAGLWAVLLVRREFIDRELTRREEQQRTELEERRRRALNRSYQAKSRR